MNDVKFFSLITTLLSLLLSIGIGVYALKRRQHSGAFPFAIVIFSESFWITGFIFEMLSNSLKGRIFWDLFQWLFMLPLALALLAFVLRFSSLTLPFERTVWHFFYALVLVFTLLVLTNPYHNLIISNPRLITSPVGFNLFYDFSLLDFGVVVFVYVIVLVSFIGLVVLSVLSQRLHRLQVIAILTGFGIIVIGSVYSLLSIPLFLGQRDISPITFAASNIIFAWGLFRFHLFDVTPIARNLVVDTIDDPVVVLDANDHIVDFNFAAQGYFGFSSFNSMGTNPNALPKEWNALFDRFRSAQSFKGEVTINLADEQRVLDLFISTIWDKRKMNRGRLFLSRDITEYKKAEKKIREGEESYTRLFNTMKEAIYILSPEGVFLNINEGAVKMYGYSQEEFVGKTPAFVSADEKNDLNEITNMLDRVFRSGVSEEFEFWGKRKNGEEFPKECIASKGKYFGRDVIITTARDVTERKKAEAELRKQTDDLELINRLNDGLNQGENIEETIRSFTEGTRRIFFCKDVSLMLLDDNRQILSLQYTTFSNSILKKVESVIHQQIPPVNIPIKETKHYKKILESGRSFMSSDPDVIGELLREIAQTTSLSPMVRPLIVKVIPQIISLLNFNSTILVPLVANGETIGILNLASDHSFSEDDLRRIERFSRQITIAILRRKTEIAIRESEKKFRSVIEHASDGIALIDKQGLIIEWNPVMEQIAGLMRPAVIGQPIWDIIFQIMPREKRTAEFQRLYAKQWQVEVHRQYAHKDTLVDFLIEDHQGNRKIVQSNPFTVETSQGVIGGVIMRDVTVQKQAETALRESEERFHQLFETAMDGIVLTRPDGTIHSANPAALSLLGHSAEEIKNVNRIDILDFSDPRVIAGLEERDRLGIFKGEFIGVRKDGSKFPMEISSVLLRQDGILASNFIRDITERKNAEHERNRLITELRNKNDELERFTYTVSHDLKAPLFTIQGFVGYLERDINSNRPDRVQNDVDRITGAIDKMQRLLNELLELSRIGRIIHPPQEVAFGTIVHDALGLLAGRIAKKHVSVEVDPDLPVVRCDRTRITQVMQNLIDNAIKFMGDQSEPRVWVGQDKKDGELVFFVRDNGMGIPSNFQDRIFGLFDRLDPNAEGTGVGLALVKRIIETHGGRIWAESEGDGKGTTFYFTVPMIASN